MKKVCFFHPSSDLYGSDKIFLNILSTFPDSKITVVLRTDGPLVGKLQSYSNIKVLIYPNLPLLVRKFMNLKGLITLAKNICRFRRFCRDNKLFENEVIYLNTIATTPILAYFGSSHLRVMHLHETIDTNKFIYRIIARYILYRADYVVCVSNAVLNPIKRVCRKLAYKLKLVYNGINPQHSATDLTLPNVNPQSVTMSLIGRIKPLMKGQNMLVDALCLLPPKTLEQLNILIVGSPVSGQEYMLSELETYINDRNMSKHISIIPFIEDISAIYQISDVILVPSLCEDSLPTTVLEAMYFGLPVIGTISGGIPEMIENDVNGILIDKHNANQLSQAIARFVDDRSVIAEMGTAGRKIFNERFTEQLFKSNYKKLLQDII